MNSLSFLKNPKIIMAFFMAAALSGGAVFSFYFMNSSDMEPLYYNLNQSDAGKIVDKLKENKIPYKIESNGSILVASEKVAEIRLQLASDGLPSQSGIGFEIFDKNRFGLSGFSEKVNYRRALEGELSRSINSIEGVLGARVHLAIPEPNMFVGKSEAASASVVVRTANGYKLDDSKIRGIIYLVSGAVEGLKPENVSITDKDGRLIKVAGDEYDSSEMNEFKNEAEKKLNFKIQNVLDKIYGQGKTVVTSDVILDMDRVESVKEIYNPQTVLTSASSTSEEESKGDSKSKKNSSDMKYQTDKTVEKYVKKTGGIKKISVSVAVSKEVKESDLPALKELVAASAGIDESRGDNVKINYFEFVKPQDKDIAENKEELMAWKKELERKNMVRDIIKYSSLLGASLIFSLGLFFISKNLSSKTAAQEPVIVSNSPSLPGTAPAKPEAKAQNIESAKAASSDPVKEMSLIMAKDAKNVSKTLQKYLEENSSGLKKETVNA